VGVEGAQNDYLCKAYMLWELEKPANLKKIRKKEMRQPEKRRKMPV